MEHYGGAVVEDLIHPLVRATIRDAASTASTIGKITDAFRDHGFCPGAGTGFASSSQGGGWGNPTRRETFNEHAAVVDWSDPRQVRPALDALGVILDDVHGEDREGVLQRLRRYGVERDERGQLHLNGANIIAELPLDVLDDPAAVLEQLDRLRRVAREDPAAAISTAKTLVEATLKRVLHELELPVRDRDDMPVLARAVHKALGLEAGAIAPTQRGAEIIKSTLGALATIPLSLAELRNTYGTDHGRLIPTVGLQPRHADLAVGSAATYVRFVLETLAERARRRP